MKIKEGNNSRIQAFTGVVIARQGGGVRETFVVRKISFGTGVERRFPLHSPVIDSIKVVRKGRVRRAKLYYLRNLRGKAARIVERRDNSEKSSYESSNKTVNRLFGNPSRSRFSILGRYDRGQCVKPDGKESHEACQKKSRKRGKLTAYETP